jgi:hypothetical protein
MNKFETIEEAYAEYFRFVGETESPILYHRWAFVSMLSSYLGRQIYIPFGHGRIYPNFYILLVGDPGTRKNTSMVPIRRILKSAGYNKISPDRISPEAFLSHLERSNNLSDTESGIELEEMVAETPCEVFVCIGEFEDFIGSGNIAFVKLLTNLWDNLDEYSHPKLHGKSVYIYQPTINVLGGITPQGITTSIPVEAIGQGYFSRIILVAADNTGNKITFPEYVDDEKANEFGQRLISIKEKIVGTMAISTSGRMVLDRMYREFVDIDDYRFRHYSTRRFTHLLKLCTIFSAMRSSMEISSDDALHANTLLHFTEMRMPRALGEFGKAKNSDVANNILSVMKNSHRPLSIKDLWKHVNNDLNKQSELIDLLRNLKEAGKIMVGVTKDNRQGFLPCHEVTVPWKEDLLYPNFLTIEEKV